MRPISERIVAELPVPARGNRLHYFSGAALQGKKAPSGFAVRVTASGARSFVWFHRVAGKPHLETLGRWRENSNGGELRVREAIIAAQKRAKAIRDGEDARPDRTRRIQDGNRPASADVTWLLDSFVTRYVESEANLRSKNDVKAALDRLVKPKIGHLGIFEIRRSHIVDMLDDISNENGPVMADRALAYVRRAFNWFAARDR